jgi:septal ring factor EnvC (AmiA/AmiB activator)
MPSPMLFLITFCSGVAATLAWQSYGDTARQVIAKRYPQLGWFAPRTAPIVYSTHDTIGLAAQAAPSPDQRLSAISLDLDAMRQNVDRIAITQEQITRSVDQLTTGQQRMTRNIDQLTAGQERITREISKLQAVEQQIKPPPRSASASARKPVARSSPAPTVR